MIKQTALRLAAAAVIAFAVIPASSAVADGTEVLTPDPNMWCADNAPFGAQVADADWVVQFAGVQGQPAQNNMKCVFQVVSTVPYGEDAFTIPWPWNDYVPVDYAQACQQQFPGSSLQWAPAGYGAWECVARAGTYYPPPNLTSGP
jgi:hypothetical protein